jgi:hypothetical protein
MLKNENQVCFWFDTGRFKENKGYPTGYLTKALKSNNMREEKECQA